MEIYLKNGVNMRKKFLSIFGLSYFVSVGYMDPGNWATDLAAGSQYGYKLIWVLVMSNIIAIILQSLTIYLTKYTNLDLAELCKEKYSKTIKYILWFLAQVAIVATDLAELLGSAVALKLLFNIPILIGVIITVLDVFLIMFLENKGFKYLHAIIVTLVLTITLCFIVELIMVGISVPELTQGLVPQIPDYNALLIAIGMIGATIMPHNLYMQSGMLKRYKQEINIKAEVRDLIIALNGALIVNGAILILAAQVFNKSGYQDVASIEQAYVLLSPLVGLKASALLFGFALLLSGQASTITGTLAGQVVMEGFLNVKIDPKKLRLITRLCAIIPAMIVIIIFGEKEVDDLLILSQVILSFQLPFALIPLVMGIRDTKLMQGFKVKRWLYIASICSIVVISGLNILLVVETIMKLTGNYVLTVGGLFLLLYSLVSLIRKYNLT